MIQPASDIRHVDQQLRQLAHDRRHHDDRDDARQINESIDTLLDQRLDLMHRAQHPGLFSAERYWNPAGH